MWGSQRFQSEPLSFHLVVGSIPSDAESIPLAIGCPVTLSLWSEGLTYEGLFRFSISSPRPFDFFWLHFSLPPNRPAKGSVRIVTFRSCPPGLNPHRSLLPPSGTLGVAATDITGNASWR